MIQRIDELTQLPKVGTRYRVSCVRASLGSIIKGRQFWVPILGPMHADPELNIRENHYHIDWRFVGPEILKHVLFQATVISNFEGVPELRIRECKREMPTFPSILCRKLEKQFEGCRVKADRPVCPHRGFSLVGLPVSADGYVICPGHGLQWDLDSGSLVSRIEGQP